MPEELAAEAANFALIVYRGDKKGFRAKPVEVDI